MISSQGSGGIGALIVVFCFGSACFACIFATGLRDLGRHTKRGGSFLVAAISGASVFTPATGAVMDATNASTAMCIPLVGYILAMVYPVYMNVWNKELLDTHRATEVGVQPDGPKDIELMSATHDEDVHRNRRSVQVE